jgi:6-phosphogluconolactonase/glucosamine-6-phosphate isomerase/deaminase
LNNLTIKQSKDSTQGAQELSERILSYLDQDKKVLWLVCGGSNVPISVEVLNILKSELDKDGKRHILKQLTVTLTDERYGSINHPDSNWRQLKEKGFDFDAVTVVPVLFGKSLDETTKLFGVNLRDAWNNNDVRVGQFGIGEDGHIAGVLPRTIGVSSPGTVVSYDAGKYKRMTITLKTIAKLDCVYVFAYGESKKKALKSLHEDITEEAQPAQVLKKVKEVVVYSD